MTAEIAQLAGVFDVAAHAMARRARHRVVLLWLLFAALAIASTIVMSLDTTAVLLTPVGLAIAQQTGIAPMPFALTTLWIANTGSLLLPVSNLTNLLAFATTGLSFLHFTGLMLLPELVAVGAEFLLLRALFRRDLAAEVGRERDPFKIDVRKLKNLGLTRSYDVGYDLSPRGAAYLRRTSRACTAGREIVGNHRRA